MCLLLSYELGRSYGTGQLEGELGTAGRRGTSTDGPVVARGDLGDDGEPESRAGHGPRRAGAVEAFEDVRQVRLGDAGTLVAHHHFHSAPLGRGQPHRHGAPRWAPLRR